LRLIGDVVFTTPAVAAVRRHYPHAHITYLVEAPAAPLLLNSPSIDELIVAERPRGLARLRYDLRLAWQLRARRFDLIIDFHGGSRSAWLTFLSGASQRIGYAAPGRSWMYTVRIPWSRALVPARHSVERQWDLIRPLGIGAPTPTQDPVRMEGDAGVDRDVAARISAAGIAADDRLIVIHVSAGNPFRRWPADRFAAVAAALARENPRGRIIITSGPSERDAADRVAAEAQQRAGPTASSIIRCGDFDLRELQSLVTRAALFIGGDSGPLHVAATTRVPVVALFGPTLPARSMPWRDPAITSIAVDAGELPCRPCHQRQCIPGDFRCLTGISTEQVLRAARSILTAGTRHETNDDSLSDHNLDA
jgi:heptosyltransferase-1